MNICAVIFLLILTTFDLSTSFISPTRTASTIPSHISHCIPRSIKLALKEKSGNNDKFSFQQRIESIKTGIIGALAGGISSAPFLAFHDISTYGLASWEFDTDMSSIQAGLFAIVYRYCIRKEDDNEMLNMGVIGAFILVRTLSRIRVPEYCTAIPLNCGDPLGYFDWSMIQQVVLNGLESLAMFGAAAAALEVAYRKNWVTKFPN